jgi:agmatine deiminase
MKRTAELLGMGLVVAMAAGTAGAQQVGRDGRLIYRQGEPLPKSLTPAEAGYLRLHPFGPGGTDVPTLPPTGPIHCAAEYEPMDGILIGWEGGAALNAIQKDMAGWVTNTGNAYMYVSCDSAAIQTSATSVLSSAPSAGVPAVNMARVRFVTRTLDSIWIRDYGPRYIFEGDCRAVVDHRYNRPRPNDDLFSPYFAQYKRHAFYELGLNGTTLVHGGGNYHLDALNRSYATRLINNENPWFTEAQIVQIWSMYQGLNTTLFTPYPTTVDATQHIDMWVQVIADDKVIVSDWPSNPGSTQDVICDSAALQFASNGYTVYRTPAFSIGGIHYTYTNMVMCNDVVMIPSYTNATVSPSNAVALSTLQSALPGKTVVQVPCQNIIGLAGAIHCIVMHVPRHRGLPGVNGGLAPTAYLKDPNGGQSLRPGSSYPVRWISDDDELVTNVDLLLSMDGGATYPTVIASGIADTGSYNWTVPPVSTSQARIRVVARDALGNTGHDSSDANFGICYANCDSSSAVPVLNVQDFTCFLQAYAAGDPYANCDNSTVAPVLNVTDFTCFLQQYAAGCP